MHSISGWKRSIPNTLFERYADDIIVHCKAKKEATSLKDAVANRLAQCKLELNEEKTQLVYCRVDHKMDGIQCITSFDFLGFTFRRRGARTGKFLWDNFSPAISNKAKKKISEEIKSWRLHRRTESTIQEIADAINAKVRGWINYYGAYYKSAMHQLIDRVQWYLQRWVQKKYKCSNRKARRWLKLQRDRQPKLFAHWMFTG